MGIYMTRWGYIQGRGRLGRGGAAALKPDLAKESVLAGIPISPHPREGLTWAQLLLGARY